MGKVSVSPCAPVVEIMKQNVSVFCYETEKKRFIIIGIKTSVPLAHGVLK